MIEREEREGTVILRLAHGKASAFDIELMEELRRQLGRLGEARAMILTGRDSIFSAGVDLVRLTNEGGQYARRFVPLLTSMLEELFLLPIPVVAAVNGHAIAGGCILTAASDYRIMARGNGRIGVPELTVGVPFPAIALEIMRFAVPAGDHLQRLVYGGKNLGAEQALQAGLIDEVVEPDALMDRALAMAGQLASIPPSPFRIVKMQLRQPSAERARGFHDADREAVAIWADGRTHDHIREYMQRTIGRGKRG